MGADRRRVYTLARPVMLKRITAVQGYLHTLFFCNSVKPSHATPLMKDCGSDSQQGEYREISVMAYDLNHLFSQVRSRLAADGLLSLNDLSHDLGVERHTIEKAVRLATNGSFRDLKQGRQYDKACSMLAETPDRPLKELSFTLGYSTVQAFHRFIINRSGLCPTKLRSSLRISRPSLECSPDQRHTTTIQ